MLGVRQNYRDGEYSYRIQNSEYAIDQGDFVFLS